VKEGRSVAPSLPDRPDLEKSDRSRASDGLGFVYTDGRNSDSPFPGANTARRPHRVYQVAAGRGFRVFGPGGRPFPLIARAKDPKEFPMMRRRKDARPVLESMESKFLLSAQAVAATTATVARPATALNGSLHGHDSQGSSNPDAGNAVTFSGAGRVGSLGQVKFSGHFGTPGFIASGHATGSLELSNARGTVTLGLAGPTQPGFSSPPSSFAYTVLNGTGAYSTSHASGTLTLGLVAGHSGGPVSLHHLPSGRVAIQLG
jgi:hypothetical protein